MFTPIWGTGQPPVTIPGNNIKEPITNSLGGIGPIKPFGSAPAPVSGLSNIPLQDVFFSDQSFRAQLFRYLGSLQGTPWMFAYQRSQRKTFWDLMIKPNQAVLVITPINDEDKQSDDNPRQQDAEDRGQENNNPSSEQQDHQTESVLIDTMLEEIETIESAVITPINKSTTGATFISSNQITESFKADLGVPQFLLNEASTDWMLSDDTPNNPFAIILEDAQGALASEINLEAKDNTPIEEVIQVAAEKISTESDKPLKQLKLQQLFGQYLESDLYLQLTEAYEKIQAVPDKCLWVKHTEDKLHVLGPESPTKYGYKRVDFMWLSNIINTLSPMASKYLNCQTGKDFLTFPNGGMLPTQIYGWQDRDEKVASLFQVKRLPNGKWLKVTAFEHEVEINLKDTEGIKKTLDRWNQSLEQMGWLRETTPLAPVQATSPLI